MSLTQRVLDKSLSDIDKETSVLQQFVNQHKVSIQYNQPKRIELTLDILVMTQTRIRDMAMIRMHTILRDNIKIQLAEYKEEKSSPWG